MAMDEIIVTDDSYTEVLGVEPEAQIDVVEDADQEVIFTGDGGIQGLPGAPGQPGPPGVDGSDDSHYTQEFSPTTALTVTHSLGKYPAVTVINSAGDEVIVEVNYQPGNLNQVFLQFDAAFGGRVVCN
jgi:hypothetical protein